MKPEWMSVGLALGVAMVVSGGGGCGPSRPPTQEELDEENRKRFEAAEKYHVIGHDSTGLPIYGVDDEGKPIYTPNK